MTNQINAMNAYNANDIRRRQSAARRHITNIVLDYLYKEIMSAADHNFDSVRISFGCETLKKYRLSNEILRSIRLHFEATKFNIVVSSWRGYFFIQW